MKFLLSFLLLTVAGAYADCPLGFSEIGGRCLYFQREYTFTYQEAKTYCQNIGGDLAQVDDCNLLDDIASFIDTFEYDVEDGYWIGADDTFIEGRFTWADGSLVAMGAPFWSTDSDVIDPEPQNDSDECLVMSVNDGYFFHNVNCYLYQGYSPLCQRDPVDGVCPAPYYEIDGSCYSFLGMINSTWDDARDICGTSGGDLAIIDDCDLMSHVIEHIKDTAVAPEPNLGYWINGHKVYNGNIYYWLWWSTGDLIPMGMPFWGMGDGTAQPDDAGGVEDCVQMTASHRYRFNDRQCSSLLYPLCEAPMPAVATDDMELKKED